MKDDHPVQEMDFPLKYINGELNPPNEVCISNGGVLKSTNKDQIPEEEEKSNEDSLENDLHFTLKIYKDFKISIYKPLIPLKLALFCWFGAGAAIFTFLSVFFKQRGLTLAEFSTVYIVSPVVQFLGPTISGVVADKLGRSKPVLAVNLLLTIIIVVGMLFVPRMNVLNSGPEKVNLKCHHHEFDRLVARTGCNKANDIMEMEHCNVSCPENVTQYCYGRNLICELLAGNEDFENFSLSVYINGTFTRKNHCYYNVSSIVHKNVSYSWCNVPHKMYCSIECTLNPEANSSEGNGSRLKLLITNMVLLILFFTTASNCYRILDVTSMLLVKEHNSDFGRERFYSVLGILVFAPVSGLLVGATTAKGAEKNYASALYLFIGLVFLTLAILYKLEVQLNAPGKKMWKKSLKLMKNPDVAAFVFVLFVLGTSFSFTKNYGVWYLEELNAPSFLLGLVPAMSSLYGMPFLVTSNWWVKKIGTTQIFLLGLIGYVINTIGYSFLIDPWLSLILEATGIITYHLLWVTVIIHSHNIAPEGLTATVISTAGAVHYSIGKASGSLIGGLIMDSFGGRKAYRVIAIICSVCAAIYGLYLYTRRTCYMKKLITSEKQDVPDNTTSDYEGSIDIYSMEKT